MNMKLNKYLCGLLIAAMGGLTSCNTDVEGEYYPLGNNDSKYVSLEAESQTVQISKDESSVTIPVSIVRSNTANALTVNFTTDASHEGIFSNDAGNSVTFQPGQATVTFNVMANNLEKEVPYNYAISLDGSATVDTLFLQSSVYVTYNKYIAGSATENDTIVVDTVRTDCYKNNPIKEMQIYVSREGDWTEWQTWNSTGTATYTYVNYWTGDDPELPFVYRQNLISTNRYQFKLSNWGYGVELLLEYDEATGHVTCPVQFTGYTHSSYGDIYVTDLANYDVMRGWDIDEADYGTFDKEQGIMTIPLVYYVSAGYFGADPEYLYIDGIERGDYTSSLSYIGVLTDAFNQVFAVGNLELGPDATNVKAIVMPQDADADAVADALAAGELEGYDVEAGQIQVPIPEDLTGKLQLIVAVILDGTVKSVSTANFEYYGGGANPWVSLGMGVYTDNLICTVFSAAPVTYEVEVLENKETPGLYKLIYPYGEIYPYNEEGDWDSSASYDIEIDATDPDGVILYEQPTGADWGYGMMSIQSVGAYYNVYGGYDLATLKDAGYLGTLKDGVITLPVLERETSAGTAQYQGFLSMGGKNYYTGSVGEFKLILPGSPAMNGAKKKAANKKHSSKTFRGVSAQKIVKNNRLHTVK